MARMGRSTGAAFVSRILSVFLVSSLVLASLLIPGSLSAEAEARSWTLPAFAANATVGYAGSFDLVMTIGPVANVLDKSLRTTSVLPIRIVVDGGALDYNQLVSVETGHLEAVDHACVRRSGETCDGWRVRDHASQGLPGLFGASALAGRTWSDGEAFTIPGQCSACGEGPRRARVANVGDDPAAPRDARFKATYSAEWRAPDFITSDEVTLYFDAEPYPLAVRSGERAYNRTYFVASGPLVPLGAQGKTYPPIGPQETWADLPPEGTAPTGVGSLHDAMEATAAPEGFGSAQPRTIEYERYPGTTRVIGHDVIEEHRDVWRVDLATSDAGATTQYQREAFVVTLTPRPTPIPVHTPWTRTTFVSAGAACTHLGPLVPMWTQAERLVADGLLSGAEILRWDLGCERPLLTIVGLPQGPPDALGLRLGEQVDVEQASGTLALWTYYHE